MTRTDTVPRTPPARTDREGVDRERMDRERMDRERMDRAPVDRRPMDRAPRFVRGPNSLVRRLLGAGLPMGPNTLLTVRGRSSGLPRSVPVAVAEIDGRRYVIGAYGDVQWVRNLRAAGVATIRLRGRDVRVAARELDAEAARTFFAEVIPAYVARFPGLGRVFLRGLFRLVARDLLSDPSRAASRRPVFELTSADGS